MNTNTATAGTQTNLRRVVTYERVSSEDQKQRETIKVQTEELARRLESEPEALLVHRYTDDGVSGTIPMAQRPAGAQLMGDAAEARFDEVWVYRIDRLGRDDVDPLLVRRELENCGVKVVSLIEGEDSTFIYSIRVAVAAEERRTMLARMNDGMTKAVKEGRYPGGIRPFGYRVEGDKQNARLVPNTEPLLAGQSEAEIIRFIYERLALDKWTCWKIADELNLMGVPTVYAQEGRGMRKQRVRGVWTPGRVRNMVVNPVYRGEFQYGKRTTKPNRPLITAEVPALVTEELWQAAMETLASNSSRPKNSERIYLLRGLIRCGHCGRAYTGTVHHRKRDVWYRCNGRLRRLGDSTVCVGKGVKGDHLEPQIWSDIERFLRDPGDILEELGKEESPDAGALLEAERTILEAALKERESQRQRMLDAYKRGLLELDELETELGALAKATTDIQDRLASLTPEAPDETTPPDEDLLAGVTARLDEGLSDAERQEITSLLVRRIVVHTETKPDAKPRARAVIEYRLPEPPVGVVATRDGTGSSPLPKYMPLGTPSCPSFWRSPPVLPPAAA